MTLYRVRYSHEAGTSVGYGWFSSRRQAQAAARAFRANTQDEEGDAAVEQVTVTLSKRGVLDMLNRWATYPDNG